MASKVAEEAMRLGLRELDIKVKGAGSSRDAAVKAIGAAGLTIRSLQDVTPIPHNGCRPSKKRRV